MLEQNQEKSLATEVFTSSLEALSSAVREELLNRIMHIQSPTDERQEEEEARIRRRREIIEALATWFFVILLVVAIGGFGILLLAKYLGRI